MGSFTVLAQNEGVTYTGSISGSVSDIQFNDALPFAHIQIANLDLGSYTNENGKFEFKNIPEGSYQLIASFVGFEAQVLEDVKVQPGVDTDIRFELAPSIWKSEEVIVVASRKKQSFNSVPASIEVITAKEIEELSITSFEQAFDQMNGLQVTRSSGSNVQTVSIRGASEVAGGGIGNRVLLLIDGRPAISPESGGALWNLIPLTSVERIEVVKGAYSSLFGSSAMGGVVNVITTQPKDKNRTTLSMQYGFYDKPAARYEYDVFNDFYQTSLSRSGKSGRLSYIFDAGWKSTNGHREKTAFDQGNLYGKFKYTFSGNRSIQLSGNYNAIKNDTPATWFSPFQAYSVAPHRKDDFQERKELNTDLFYEAVVNKNIKYNSRFYYYQNNSDYSFNDDPDNDTTNVNTGTSQIIDESSVLSKRIGNVTQIDWYSNDNHYIIAGVDTHYDYVNGIPDTVLYGEHNAFNIGFFAQDEIHISEKLQLTAGLRYDNYRIVDAFDESNLSPKIALLYKQTNKLSFRALFAQAYRTPSMAERYIKFEQGGGLRFLPNPDLQSEKLNTSLEIGTKWQATERLQFNIAAFYNRYNNLISYQQISNFGELLTYKVINLKKALMQGVEFEFGYKNQHGSNVQFGYTYLDARDISEGRLNDNLAYKVKHSLHFSLNQSHKDWVLNINGNYRSAIKEVFIYPGSEPDAYFVINGRLSYQFNKNHSAFVSIKNIGDTQYEELERYRMAGRSYTFGVRFNWE